MSLGDIRDRADYLWGLAVHVAPQLARPSDLQPTELLLIPETQETNREGTRTPQPPRA